MKARRCLTLTEFLATYDEDYELDNLSDEYHERPMENKYSPTRSSLKNSPTDMSNNWRTREVTLDDDHEEEIQKRCSPDGSHHRRQFTSLQNQKRRPMQYRNYTRRNWQSSFKKPTDRIDDLPIEMNLDVLEITEMANLDPSEIIMKLAAPGSGVKKLLSKSSIDPQLLASFLGILNKIIGCTINRHNLIHLLSQIIDSIFITQVLPSHILEYNTSQEDTFPLIDHILVLINELISIFPTRAFTDVTIVKTLLQKAVDDAQTNGKIFSDATKQKLATLHNVLKHLQDKKQEGLMKSENDIYLFGNRGNKEEEDFRDLSVYPTYNDLCLDQKPSMRQNIIKGSYSDAKSYLDTHFRLLREDFIRPLRDGISQLLVLNRNEQAMGIFDDIRIYFDTQILPSVCVRSGIVHQVRFSTKNMKHVLWGSSKRLLYGALVCLSKDNFENMLFATVTDRSVTDLRNGIITLMFTEESRKKLVEYSFDDTFLMVETTAYFEAYRHVLEGLKEMVDGEIPFQNHIVHSDTTVCAPAYFLQNHTHYSLDKLIKMQDLIEKKTHNLTTITDIPKCEKVPSPDEDKGPLIKFDVLDFSTWPSKEELELDSSQFEAFQMSLTSELSLIQGPPGTGNWQSSFKKPTDRIDDLPIEMNLDVLEITEMANLDPSEIIMKLAAPGSGVKKLLSKSSIDPQLLASFLGILNKIIGCTINRHNLIHLLSQIIDSIFITQVLPSHILEYNTSQEDTFPLIDHILVLINELISIFPTRAFTDVTIVKTLLQKAVDDAQTNGKIFSDATKQKLATLHNVLKHLQDKKQEGLMKSENDIYLFGNRGNKEEEDFRDLSVYPTYNDLCLDQKPSMRQNIIKGSYSDAKSYLDTHFRLLREDFIRPLRDGISQLLVLNRNEQAMGIFDDIRIYFDTQILPSVCVRSGIVHQVRFSTKNMKHVLWGSSKRLLYGALVCLSKDNFENMLFATVTDRSVTDLRNGIITLMFTEESRKKLVEYSFDDTFLMVETTAYFEAYRHVLEGLKEMVDGEIPFQNHIVHSDTTVCAPAYFLQNHTHYSLDKLIKMQDLIEKKTHNLTTITDIPKCEKVPSPDEDKGPLIKFDVLDFSTWPSKEELELDGSQFEAFQMSLTSELSLIQGPPGTGKTYVGLKIVQALLNNTKVWKEGNSPILVVCYTNHALDQFLTGIYKATKCEIVRVGSRSNSELMKTFNLRNRHAMTPVHLLEMREELASERYEMQEKINDMSSSMQNAFKGILHENVLKKHINPYDFQCLVSGKEVKDIFDTTSVMAQWLGVSALFSRKDQIRDDLSAETDVTLWTKDVMPEENDEPSVSEKKVEEPSIEVVEEPERARFERMTEDFSDIKEELSIVNQKAERRKKNILAFELTQEVYDNQKENPYQISMTMVNRLKNRIKNELQKETFMDEEEYENITDFWDLPILKRWEIYRLWRNIFMKEIRLHIFELENKYQLLINRLTELKNQEDFLKLKKADIIGMTTTGAAKCRSILQNVRPRIVVVEEAAEVLEAHIITSLSPSCQHLILIGDHQQLRPTTMVYELAKKFNLEVSMFERLIRMEMPYVRLDYQHRMRPEIAQLLTPHIYDKLENHESVYKYDNIKGVLSNLFFVDHNHLEEHIKEGKSHQNSHEAAFVRSLCLYLIQQGYSPSEITILTTYTGQLHCIQKMMPKSIFEGVRICVVDKYQGEENEIIILSLVRSNLEGNVGFLKIPNRVCVALSRAKKGLFCIGNMQLLSSVPLWSKIIDVLRINNQIGNELKLQCQNHPNTISCVSTAHTFVSVPEGGCMIPCESRLGCGHVCTLMCHPYDPEHNRFKCMKPCPKLSCADGHKCKKVCSDPCGQCEVLVPKKIPLCEHIQNIPCSMHPSKWVCKEPCTKILKCGHKCNKSCGENCSCTTKVTVTLECGHITETQCRFKTVSANYGFGVKCNKHITFCGHPCPGYSSDSYKCQGPCAWNCTHEKCTQLCCKPCDRKACDEPCQKTLKCGHLCIGLCGEHCPQKCKICDADEVTKQFFGKEADPNARFVQLMDCPHFFEVTEFTKWLKPEEKSKENKLISCPKCSTNIRHSFRYGNVIKQINANKQKEMLKSKIFSKRYNL
ncbi:NFX1-type zinc finger-containing protein 1-like [Discoglossus pictus]